MNDPQKIRDMIKQGRTYSYDHDMANAARHRSADRARSFQGSRAPKFNVVLTAQQVEPNER